jgi:hypothetical protein
MARNANVPSSAGEPVPPARASGAANPLILRWCQTRWMELSISPTSTFLGRCGRKRTRVPSSSLYEPFLALGNTDRVPRWRRNATWNANYSARFALLH